MSTQQFDRHTLLAGIVATQAGIAINAANASETPPELTSRTFSSFRHTTRYWEVGPVDGRLMIFVHGWPEIGLMWRAQVEAFASQGWRCVAPICAAMVAHN